MGVRGRKSAADRDAEAFVVAHRAPKVGRGLCGANRTGQDPRVSEGSMIGNGPGIIERAFELAQVSANVEEIRIRLRNEGYASVDAHLMGRKIRSDLVKQIRQAPRA